MKRTSCVLVLLTLVTYSVVADNEQKLNATRAGRQWEIPRDMRFVRLFMDQQQHQRRPPQIAARSDHLPPRIGSGPPVQGAYGRPPFGRPPLSHVRRRVYSGPPGPPPPGLFLRPNGPPPQFQSFKNTRFSLAKDPHVHKGSPINYRPGLGLNPNTIPEAHNFKPSPIYNGEVIVRHPLAASLTGVKKSEEIPRHFKQHPIPAPADPNHMYSVHEDTDSEGDGSFSHPNIGENAMKQAKQYLNFMSSSEYFLPKIEPDYRKLDQSKQQLKQKSAESAAVNSFHHQKQHQQQQQRNSESSSLNTAFTVNAPLRVSSSYSQAQAQAQGQVSQGSSYPSSYPAQAIVGSFQAGNNDFVVSSDGKKNIHSIPSTSFSSSAEASHQRQSNPTYSNVLRPKLTDRVSDPERVEFTERDAIHVSYTSNPMDSISRKIEKQIPLTDRQYIKPAATVQEDDEEELMQAASDVYGRVKANPNEVPSNPSIEQKDTEEYCERICSNVQDEDEEVVCGSDGFMYTSEAQMECYASCLHIDVTIQSKGTCNQPL